MTDAGARAREAHEAALADAYRCEVCSDYELIEHPKETFDRYVLAYLTAMASAGFKLVATEPSDDDAKRLAEAIAQTDEGCWYSEPYTNKYPDGSEDKVSGYGLDGRFDIKAAAMAWLKTMPPLPPEEGR